MVTMKALNLIFVLFIFIPSMINGQMWGNLKYSIRKKAENNDDNNNLIKNMSYYWNKTNSLLEDISTDEWSSLHDIFPNTISNFQRKIDNSDNKKNNEICLQNSKEEIISTILSLTGKNYQCLNNQLQNYHEFIETKILSNHNVISNYPSCSKKNDTPQKILICIDNEISKKNKKNSDKINQDLLKTMNEKNTTIIKQIKNCIKNNVTKHLDKIVSNTTNNFYSCIKNSGKKLNTEKMSNSKLPTSQSSNDHEKLSSLYNYQIKIMEENISERKNLFRLFEVNARSYQSDIVWSIEDASNKSVRCCLNLPRVAIGRASIIANDKSTECLTSVLSKYNRSIITQIKSIQLKYNNVFKNCFQINRSTESTLNCIDDIASNDKSNSAKSFNEISVYLKDQINHMTTELANCIKKVSINFRSSISLAQINFDECIISNNDKICHVITDNI